MNRILVMGNSGAGKSTLSRKIGEKLKLPVVHLDLHYWKPGWVESTPEEFRERVSEIVQSSSWVMDGTFASTFDLRLPLADRVAVLDFPRLTCICRAVTRIFKYSKKLRRPDMAEGCDESIDLRFYLYIWNFRRDILPKIQTGIRQHNLEHQTSWLHNDEEVGRFLGALK